MTNNHVISCKEDALIAIVIFHFESENRGISVQLRPNSIFYTNKVHYITLYILSYMLQSENRPEWKGTDLGILNCQTVDS